MDIAKIVKQVVEKEYNNEKSIDIIRTASDDNRSYHINSDKIKKVLGFVPEFTIEDAVKELCDAFKNKLIKDSFNNDIFYNVKRLKSLNIT